MRKYSIIRDIEKQRYNSNKRLIFIISILVVVIIFSQFLRNINPVKAEQNILIKGIIYNNSFNNFEKYTDTNKYINNLDKFLVEKEKIRLAQEQKKIFDLKVNKLESFIKKMGDDNYAKSARTILNTAIRCKVDYKLLVAISGVESGFGNINVGKYNPYGYITGIPYTSYDQAINDIYCKFYKYYVSKGLNTAEKIARIYTGSDNNQKWINLVKLYLSKIKNAVE